MVFSALPFLYFFLPALLGLYFLSSDKLKNYVLLIFSLVFYALGELRFVPLLLGVVLFTYLSAHFISSHSGKSKKAALALSITAVLIPLLYFKYAAFLLDILRIPHSPKLSRQIPLGISFYTFQSLGYICDVYRGKCERKARLSELALYLTLFPQLIAGPIVRYTDISSELENRAHSAGMMSSGIVRFTTGLAKKLIIADSLGYLSESVGDSVLGEWIYALSITLQLYYDFSGYSDMAVGLGSVFGFTFPENFNYPYISSSISEFWRRWHMTLGSWFRDYVYIPLGGNRVSKMRWAGDVLLVWLLTGLWHGADTVFVLWGLYFAFFLVLEKLLGRRLDCIPVFLRRAVVFLIVMLGFVLFDSASPADFLTHLRGMLGDTGAMTDTRSLYYLKSYAGLLIISLLGSTPVPKAAANRLCRTKSVLSPIYCLLLLIVSTAYMTVGSYSPFLYFRF